MRLNAGQDDLFISKVHFRKPRQAFYNPGIGAAFLSRYYMVTRHERARQIARGLLQLSAWRDARSVQPLGVNANM